MDYSEVQSEKGEGDEERKEPKLVKSVSISHPSKLPRPTKSSPPAPATSITAENISFTTNLKRISVMPEKSMTGSKLTVNHSQEENCNKEHD